MSKETAKVELLVWWEAGVSSVQKFRRLIQVTKEKYVEVPLSIHKVALLK